MLKNSDIKRQKGVTSKTGENTEFHLPKVSVRIAATKTTPEEQPTPFMHEN